MVVAPDWALPEKLASFHVSGIVPLVAGGSIGGSIGGSTGSPLSIAEILASSALSASTIPCASASTASDPSANALASSSAASVIGVVVTAITASPSLMTASL